MFVVADYKRPSNSNSDRQTSISDEHAGYRVVLQSMLYGNRVVHTFEAALDRHRQYCRRWGCSNEYLYHSIAYPDLYSRFLFMLHRLLEEILKPEDERQEWLL